MVLFVFCPFPVVPDPSSGFSFNLNFRTADSNLEKLRQPDG